MKLEYLYHNNNNLKYTLKTFSIFGFAVILFYFLIIICISENVNWFFILMFIVIFLFWNIVFLIIIALTNNYKRKQFMYIKNKGKYFEGVIIMASYDSAGIGERKLLSKDSGNIIVSVDNKTYTITDIDYNNEFKILEQKINDNFNINRQQFSDLDQHFRNNGTFYKAQTKEIKIGIYVLDNKVIADLNSIQVN